MSDVPGTKRSVQLQVFDLRDKWGEGYSIDESYDLALAVTCLQGLVNREAPRLVVYGLPYGNWAKFVPPANFDGNIDRYVLGYSTREGAWLENASLEEVHSLEELLERYRDHVKGLVVWDDNLEATANVATTVAGVEGLLPVRFAEGSYPSGRPTLYRVLTEKLGLPVKLSLVGLFTGTGIIPGTSEPSTGSAKCDAYLWAKERYLDTGLCRADLIGYIEDAYSRKHPANFNSWLGMRDYLVSERGFLVDVNVWDDEPPVDDLTQPLGTDRRTLDAVLESAYARTGGRQPVRVMGFPPWAEKYTNHGQAGGKHDPVATEWELARIVTPYNGHLVVDIYQGFTANLSLYRHAPRIDALSQSDSAGVSASSRDTTDTKPTLNVLFYMGDYCDIGAVYNILPINWDDPARGQIPLAWSFTPVMTELLPDLFRWMYETRTPNDHFVFGPGVYGYNMPNNLPAGIPYDTNRELLAHWAEKLDVDATGFFIGYEPPNEATLALYSAGTPSGVLTNHWPVRDAKAAVPHLGMYDLCTPGVDPDEMVGRFIRHVEAVYPQDERNQVREGFVAFRCIWVEPALITEVVNRVRQQLDGWQLHVADPHEFLAAYAASGEQR